MNRLLNKRGDMMGEEVIFIVGNVLFTLLMLSALVFGQTGKSAVYEQAYSKKIAFFIDSAKPGMTISLQSQDLLDLAKSKNADLSKVISIDSAKQKVTIKIDSANGYSASYFGKYPVKVTKDLSRGNEIVLEVG